MTTTAIVMMAVAIATVWGGLAVSVAYLVTHPVEEKVDGRQNSSAHLDI